MTKAALDLLGAADRSGAAVARRVLGKFAAAADAFDVANAPDLHLVEEDDGAILIEWAFADRRLGFSIEQQPEDSGWYFVLSNDSSERYEAGRLDQLKMRRLVKIMLTEQGGSGPPAVAPLEGQIDRLFDEIRDLVVRSAENPASKSEIERKREELRALQEKEAAAWRRDRVARAHLKPGEGYRLLELAANLLDS
ncbi:MAG: hypothetical protein GY719_14760 [bacterium]|nr:hypothetical protein [bacterium]